MLYGVVEGDGNMVVLLFISHFLKVGLVFATKISTTTGTAAILNGEAPSSSKCSRSVWFLHVSKDSHVAY